jgi:hypothetical protein
MASQSIPIQVDLSNFSFQQERMNTAQAADYLGVSEQFLRTNVVTKRHAIPIIKVGSKTYYLKSDLNAYLLKQRAVNESSK